MALPKTLQVPDSVTEANEIDQGRAQIVSIGVRGDSWRIKKPQDKKTTAAPAINRTVSANHPKHPIPPSYHN